MFDFFDEKSYSKVQQLIEKLEGHQQNLIKAGFLKNNANLVTIMDQTVIFHGVLRGKRLKEDGREECLISWNPPNL